MKIRNVALQAKLKSGRHSEAQVSLRATFTEKCRGVPDPLQKARELESYIVIEFLEMRVAMEEGNREVGIISSVSYYLSFYIYHLICYFSFMAGLQWHAIKTKNRNHLIN